MKLETYRENSDLGPLRFSEELLLASDVLGQRSGRLNPNPFDLHFSKGPLFGLILSASPIDPSIPIRSQTNSQFHLLLDQKPNPPWFCCSRAPAVALIVVDNLFPGILAGLHSIKLNKAIKILDLRCKMKRWNELGLLCGLSPLAK